MLRSRTLRTAPPTSARCVPLSITRLTRLLTRKEISPPAGRKIPFFFTKILHFVQNFCEKDQKVPCCRRRFCRSPGETPGLMNHRVTRVNYTRYAVPLREGDIASARPEAISYAGAIKLDVSPDASPLACGSMVRDFSFFSRTSGSKSRMFVKKTWNLPLCRWQYPLSNGGSRNAYQLGRFAVFAHCTAFVIRTPTTQLLSITRVTR
jgi:hypothetical protein